MDKQTIFRELSAKLADMGIPKMQIDRQIKQFDDYLCTLNEEDFQKELQILSDTGKAARNIAAEFRGESDTGSNASESYTLPNISIFEEENASDPLKGADTSVSESEDEDIVIARPRRPRNAKRPVASGETIVTPIVNADRTVQKNAAEGKSAPVGKPTGDTVDFAALAGKKTAPDRHNGNRPNPAKEGIPSVRAEKPLPSSMIRFSELDSESAIDLENQKMFWVVFGVTSPITLMLLLAIGALFAGAFLVIAGIIAFCLAALVGISAVGACGSLIGMIYGVIQMIGHSPAGLYEIGFAMIVAGGTLFIGILLYNIAIRLMPVVLHYLFKFIRYTVNQGIRLFHFIKRECTGK